VAFTPDANDVYVTNFNGWSVSEINTASYAITGGVSAGIGRYPQGVAITPQQNG
jgi:DNA-binding beta-propeller fold protein YncE